MDKSRILPVAEVERRHILTTLKQCGGNKTLTARVLEISLRGLRLKLKTYGSDHRQETGSLLKEVFGGLDILPSSVAILDPAGQVIVTNRRWEIIADAGGLGSESHDLNYILECEAAASRGCEGTSKVVQGIEDVAHQNILDYAQVYECPIGPEFHWYQLNVVPNYSAGVAIIHTDVSHLEHDVETHLANKRLFDAQITHSILRAHETERPFFCLVVSLLETRRATLLFGEKVVPLLVLEVARRLRECVGAEGLVGRTGPVEFSIVWTGSVDSQVECARLITSALRPNLMFGLQMTGVSALVGSSAYPLDGEIGAQLVEAAKAVQVEVKRNGAASPRVNTKR